ncbi:MAG: hypothetical protein DCF16_09235 [Alphaproteobacteria bacterium]|nr:MAG: hypothetical protein DCF16_09235 [Alphaproteobacteria bacterium]
MQRGRGHAKVLRVTDAVTPPRRSIVRRWGPRALFESLLIVFSISLALAINAWITDLQTAARVREARAYFIEELQGNRAMLLSDSILPHHRRLHAALEAAPMEQPLTPEEARPTLTVVFATGIHTSALRDVAWSTFSNRDLLGHMQPEQVFALNDAYEAQARIEQLHAVFYPVLVQLPSEFTSAEDARGPLMSLRIHLADVIVAEEYAVERFDQALAALGAEPSAE